MVAIQQGLLHPAAAVGIPVHREHIGKIVSRYIHTPAIPIEQSNIVPAVAGQEVVPDVGVSLNDRHIPMRSMVGVQSKPCINQTSIKIAPLRREKVSEAIGEK